MSEVFAKAEVAGYAGTLLDRPDLRGLDGADRGGF
jgi:hypothetical protein